MGTRIGVLNFNEIFWLEMVWFVKVGIFWVEINMMKWFIDCVMI